MRTRVHFLRVLLFSSAISLLAAMAAPGQEQPVLQLTDDEKEEFLTC